MGAEFICEKVQAKNKIDLIKIHDSLVKQAKYDYGHSGYTGSFAESPGLTIAAIEFESENGAEEYLCNHAKKWENSIAVKIKNTEYWLIGGVFSS